MKRIILAGLLLAAAAGAQPYAQSVKEADRTERAVVSGQCAVNLVATTTATCTAYTVPAGKRLAIGQASLVCEFTAQSMAGLVSAELRTQLAGRLEMTTPLMYETFFWLAASLKTYSADDPVTLYADAGTSVTVRVERTAGAAATAVCTVQFQGSLNAM